MAQVFLSRPVIVTPPPVEPYAFPGISDMVWVGWDGSEWNLMGDESVFLAPGIRGFGMPGHNAFIRSSPGRPGGRYAGHRTVEREVFWPTVVYNDISSVEWQKVDRAFWRTMHPDRPGIWRVTTADGVSKQMELRFKDDAGHVSDHDPSQKGWDIYGITLTADQPFWEGSNPVVKTWSTGDTRDFFNSPGKAPDFYISASATFADAVMDNPGDEEAFPVWRLRGPITTAVLGVNGKRIGVPFPVVEGETLTIDPRTMSAVSNYDGDKTRQLAGYTEFASIPPAQGVEINLQVLGFGEVEASLTPLYRRLW